MARVLTHLSFTCTLHVHPLMEWTIPGDLWKHDCIFFYCIYLQECGCTSPVHFNTVIILRIFTLSVFRERHVRWLGSCWPAFIGFQPATYTSHTSLVVKSLALMQMWSVEISGETSGLSIFDNFITLLYIYQNICFVSISYGGNCC